MKYLKRPASLFMFGFFVWAVFLQYNDIDSGLWMVFYLLAAIVTFMDLVGDLKWYKLGRMVQFYGVGLMFMTLYEGFILQGFQNCNETLSEIGGSLIVIGWIYKLKKNST